MQRDAALANEKIEAEQAQKDIEALQAKDAAVAAAAAEKATQEAEVKRQLAMAANHEAEA